MRVVVTGATGNMGTALLTRLAAEDVDLVGIARRTPPDVTPYSGVTWHSVDLARHGSETELRSLFETADAVVHLAVAFQPMRDRDYLRRTNVDGTERVARSAFAAGVQHLVHMSSSGVYSRGAYGVEVDEEWSRDGIAESTYSTDKAAAEKVLDRLEEEAATMTVTRLRPGLVGQYAFGSALARYALPDLVPSAVVDHIPFVPMDRSVVLPAVATSDVADAIVAALATGHGGAYNLAAPTPVRAQDFERALDARSVAVTKDVLRALVSATFTARLQSVHPGWVDLAYGTPLLRTERARRELNWAPTSDEPAVLAETIGGIRRQASGPSAPLRERTLVDRVQSVLRRGPLSRRQRP